MDSFIEDHEALRELNETDEKNGTVLEVTSSIKQNMPDAGFSKVKTAAFSSKRKNDKPKTDRTTKTINSGTEKPGIKRQRSNDIWVADGKRLKEANSLRSVPGLQVAIINRNHPLGKITMDKLLLLEEN